MIRRLLAVTALAAIGAPLTSAFAQQTATAGVPVVSDRAKAIFKKAFVVDTHNDMPSRMADLSYNPDERHAPGYKPTEGHTDLPRLIDNGISGVFLSAFVDAKYALTTPDSSAVRVFQLIDSIQAFTKRHPKEVLFSTSAADLRRAKKDGKIAVFIGVEGGHAIRGSLDTLRVLAAKGVRYMTLTWNNGNSWAGAARGVNGTSTAGLTEFGKEVVRTMNDLGILVDVSHVSRQTFYDAIAASRVPVIASHSSSRALTDVPRNLDDDQLRAVAKNGGVVNVNFYSDFVRTSGKSGDPVPFSVLIDHFDHIAKVAGVDHVGIGSDFDGIDAAPQGIDDVTSLPRIAQALLDRGYSEADLLKMLGGNMLRVLDESVDHRAETMRKRAGAN